ncbi:hypothetical protein GCM10010145_06350 [Streptomyces ruber]|uniref:Uncharacterized protein n=2 Tax=Streptomyces TaxID=1883 RepID=A0A918EN73_9ACTN|nr:hypothetical protein [Streptomyces ruber]GGQ40955.1 hypothetical protein GCM10010145_06350 [Streptomyces ruber]
MDCRRRPGAFWRLEFDPAPMLVVHELEGGRYMERTTALAGATTHLDTPFPVAPSILPISPGSSKAPRA